MNDVREIYKTKEKEIPEDAWIAHGMQNHAGKQRYDCLECIEIELEFLQTIKKAGGITKFIEQEKKQYGK